MMRKINTEMVAAFAAAREGAKPSRKIAAAISRGVAIAKAADRRRERAEEISDYLVSLGYTPKGRIIGSRS